MKNWFKKNYKTIIVFSFLIPIITVALVSISHVTKWYGISNPMSWAIYLSIGIEIAALSALAAISVNMGSKVYFPFGIVTLIQFIGNIYFAYSYIDINGESFKSWVELVSPLLEYMGIESTDNIGHKRFLSFFAGGMLPIISLTFLHMLVKFSQEEKKTLINEQQGEIITKNETKDSLNNEENENPIVDSKDIIGEVSRVRLSEEDLNVLEKILNKKSTTIPEPLVQSTIEKDENFIGESLEELKNSSIEPPPTSVTAPAIVPEPVIGEQQSIVEESPIHNEVEIIENYELESLRPMSEDSPIIDLITPNNPQIIEETSEPIIEEEPLIESDPVVEGVPETIVENKIEELTSTTQEAPIEEVDVEKKKY